MIRWQTMQLHSPTMKGACHQKKCLPADHIDLARILNNIGILHRKTKNFSNAITCIERTLEIQQKGLISPYHPSLAITYSSKAMIFEDQYRYQEAIEYALLSVEIAGYSLRPVHPDT